MEPLAYIGAGMCALSMMAAAIGVAQVWTTIISTVGRNPQVKKDVEKLADSKIENSVGNLLFELVEQGKIGHSQELRLKELLLARFSNKGLGNEFLRIIRDGGYIWTLGNFESGLCGLCGSQ